jgi:hypothetical protein
MPRPTPNDPLRTIGEAIGTARALLDSTYEPLVELDQGLANAIADAVDLIDEAIERFGTS